MHCTNFELGPYCPRKATFAGSYLPLQIILCRTPVWTTSATPTLDIPPDPAGDGDWWQNTGGRKWKGGRQPSASINFITAHDGFTLADLVAYNKKHNEANGESNRCMRNPCRQGACLRRP